MFKICIFNLRLKLSDVFTALTDCGKLFQTYGRATEKGQSPNLFWSMEPCSQNRWWNWSVDVDELDRC